MADKSSKTAYQEQNKVSVMGVVSEAPNFIAVAVSAFLSRSLIMWVDFLSSLCNLTRTAFIAYLSKKLQSNLAYKYNYGIARLEAISSLFCDCIMILGVLCILACSVVQIITPQKPSDLLFYIIFVKIINVAVDGFILYKQYKIKKVNNSKVIQTEFEAYFSSFAFDAAVLVAVVLSVVTKNSAISVYVGPVSSILIAIYVFITSAKRIKDKIKELTDETLDEERQFQILKVLNRYHSQYEHFVSLNSHEIGDMLYIDLVITFADDEKYQNICKFTRELADALEKEIGDCEVSVIVNEVTAAGF